MISARGQLPANLSYNHIANINEDKFLFCVTLSKFEYDCCCNQFSLRTGSLMISFILVLCGVSSFLSVFYSNNLFNYLYSLSILSTYSLCFILLLASAIISNYFLAYVAYLIYTFVLIVSFIEMTVVSIMILFRFVNPSGSENPLVKTVSFFLIGCLLSFVFIYCLWIIFCYMIHLKYGHFDLVKGDYSAKTMDTAVFQGGEITHKLL